MCNIKNGNVYLVGDGFNKPSKIFSSFESAESVLLNKIRALKPCGFCFGIVCVQVDTNITRKIMYTGSVIIKGDFKHIVIECDIKASNGCKKAHREKIRINLNYQKTLGV